MKNEVPEKFHGILIIQIIILLHHLLAYLKE